MNFDDVYTNLPAEPKLAFVQLEAKYRSELEETRREADERANLNACYLTYINQTLAAARALCLEIFLDWKVPRHEHNLWDAYRDFSADVEHYLVQIKVQHGRRISGHSVALDTLIKLKLHHHIDQIREIVLKLEVLPAKKEALIARVASLSDEVDRDRTRIEALAALTLEVGTTTGEAARRLKPVKGILDTVAKLLGYAKTQKTHGPAYQRLRSESVSNRHDRCRQDRPLALHGKEAISTTRFRSRGLHGTAGLTHARCSAASPAATTSIRRRFLC